MMNIEDVSGGVLRPATWRSTYILKPDQKVLVQSMVDFGWLSPLVVNSKDNTIIDGHERWVIAANEQAIVERDGGMVPVQWVECDEIDAMLMHVRLNRGRGLLYAKPLSGLLRKVVRSAKYDDVEIRQILGMQREEYDLLLEPSLLKTRKISEHKYSRAWVPVEASPGSTALTVNIERPPNSDQAIR
jgi:ParB-like chromosome segregation protein Spo0J